MYRLVYTFIYISWIGALYGESVGLVKVATKKERERRKKEAKKEERERKKYPIGYPTEGWIY